MLLLLYLFFFLSPSRTQNVTDMIANNPLLAKMSMFQDFENATIPLPPEESSEEEDDELIRRMSTKRSSSRETVSDNFDSRYHQMNETLFSQADLEIGDLDYREFDITSISSPDDLDLQKALQEETATALPSTSPFAASSSFFETPIVAVTQSSQREISRSASIQEVGSFAKTSPYFKAFPSTPTSSFVSSSPSESSEFSPLTEHPVTPSFESTPIILSHTTEEEDKFFMEPDDQLEEDNDIEDISNAPDEVTTSSPTGLPTATFQGANFIKLKPLENEEFGAVPSRRDENEVIQYNGRYSVSATKYYVDNRVDGEHLEIQHIPESIEDTIEENGVEEVDPFAVEREMRKVAKMHAAKTRVVDDPLAELEIMMSKDNELKHLDDEVPEKETIRMEVDNRGNNVETRETTYRGEKDTTSSSLSSSTNFQTTVKLWNPNLHGHDLMRFPGAIFDDRIDEPRRKSDKRRAVASRVLVSRDGFRIPSRHRNVAAGVTTTVKRSRKLNEKERKTTEDVESVCFNSKKNTALVRISPLETDDNVTKLECLTKCARSDYCSAATYSVPLATCAMYPEILELQSSAIRSQGHSLHRKLSKTTLRCVKMFVSKEFFDDQTDESENEEYPENDIAPPFLRLVEKDKLPSLSTTLLFTQRPRCPAGQDVIFVRSDDVEAAHNQERRDFVEISEDDCVFACLTNTRPGGGTSDCTAIEYDKTRGFCYLMTSAPGDVAMTPRPVHPVTTYEKICIQQKSANKCSGGQPIRHRQKVLIGHLVDAHSVGSAAECVDLCIEKHTIGCVSIMFYAKEPTLNCILNDATNHDDPASFYDEMSTVVDFFSIQDCLGIREVNRRAKKRLFQNRADQLARLRRKMARL